MEENKYLKDIRDIREMMSKSTQFISLSGLSGVLAGIYALAGAYLVKVIINEYVRTDGSALENPTFQKILWIALAVLLLSLVTVFALTWFKARREGEQFWNTTSKRLLANFLIPLITGGVFGLILLRDGYFGLIAPVTLLFYGLSCLNASKYTFRDVRYLGLTIIVIGLIAAAFPWYGLELWALGFGICHIVYGSIMYFKYDRN